MVATPIDHGHDHGRPGPSPLARRIGPIVAAVGVLVALSVLVWVAVAPDNVVGTVAEAGLRVPATAVTQVDDGGCMTIVDGDGSRRTVCAEAVAGGFWGESPVWDDDGRLLIHTVDGPVVIDAETGDVLADGDAGDVGDQPRRPGFDPATVEGSRVLADDGAGPDGSVVLDLGGPTNRLRSATVSPDGSWAVAIDEQQRVLVASADDPTTVHVWFTIDEDRWFEPWDQVRWDD